MASKSSNPTVPHRVLDQFLRSFRGGAREFAAQVGTHESVVCHWRANRRVPGEKYRKPIQRLTGIEPDAWGPLTKYDPTKYKRPDARMEEE